MTNVNTQVIRIYPATAPDSKGVKFGYVEATAKAAEGDTVTIKNANSIIDANLKLSSITQEDVNITDDDTASSNGVAVYVKTNDGENAWLEFVSPTNADGTGTLNSGGSTYFIFDNDNAATDSVALYFDDDGSTEQDRLLIDSPSGKDLYVNLASGKRIKLTNDSSASSNGTQVYFDEDASNSYERLLSTTANDANSTAKTDTTEEVGDFESLTLSSNVITLTSERVGNVKGMIVYK